jgi:hypothetical protein
MNSRFSNVIYRILNDKLKQRPEDHRRLVIAPIRSGEIKAAVQRSGPV